MNDSTVWMPPADENADDATAAIRKRIEKLADSSGREVDNGCTQLGSGGVHSDSYGDDGDGACQWCGARPAEDAEMFSSHRDLLDRLEEERAALGAVPTSGPEPEQNRAARRATKKKRGKGVTR